MLRNMRIGPRMILVGTVLIFLTVFSVTALLILKSSSSITALDNERLLSEARVSARVVSSVFGEETKLLLSVAGDPDVVDSLDVRASAGASEKAAAVARARAKLATFARDQRLGGSYESLAVLAPDGSVVADGYGGGIAASYAGTDVFTKALAGQVTAGDATVSPTSGRPVFPIAAPVVSNSRFVGVCILTARTDFLRDIIAGEKVGKTGYMFVVDRRGLIIAHPDPAEIMKVNLRDNAGTRVFAQKMVDGQTGVLTYTSTKGVPKIGAFAPVSGLGWSVAMGLPVVESHAIEVERDISGMSILVALIAYVVSVAVYFLFSRSITVPLHAGMRFAEKIATGDFTVRLEAKSRDEVGSLVRTLNTMAETLGSMVVTVQQSTEQVSGANGEISHSAQNLAEGAQRQAATIEETSAAIEELTASVDQVADHARRQAAAVKDGASSMVSVRKSMEEVSASLERIDELSKGSVARSLEGSQAVGKAIEGIAAISESSEKISGIITVITDIADQTNLLALNASIEAARAGEHGRGFAVVASEVSKLAERSAQAAKEIEALIKESSRNVEKGVQTSQGARGAMDEIQRSSKAVQEMIAGLTRSMAQQVEGVTKLSTTLTDVSDMSQNISAATDEQSRSMRQVATSMESMSEITQGAAASAEQMSSATDRVAVMARDLQKIVGQLSADTAVQRTADYFPWTEELALGIPIIDGQHHRLVDMVNALHRAMVDNDTATTQKKVIADMVDYAATHFALEEEYMRQFSFGGRDAHVKAHEAFTVKARELKQRSDAAGFVLSMEIIDYLKDWLQKHIMGTDRQYRDCFLKNGVA